MWQKGGKRERKKKKRKRKREREISLGAALCESLWVLQEVRLPIKKFPGHNLSRVK